MDFGHRAIMAARTDRKNGMDPQPVQLKLLSLNCCMLPTGFTASSGALCSWRSDRVSDRLQALMRYVCRHEYDILLLQEVFDAFWSDHGATFIRLAKDHGFPHSARPRRGWLYPVGSGLLIVSKHRIKRSAYHVYNATCGFQRIVPRGVLYAEVDVSSIAKSARARTIHLFTTHLHCGALDSAVCNRPATTKRVQREQLVELREFMARCVASGVTQSDVDLVEYENAHWADQLAHGPKLNAQVAGPKTQGRANSQATNAAPMVVVAPEPASALHDNDGDSASHSDHSHERHPILARSASSSALLATDLSALTHADYLTALPDSKHKPGSTAVSLSTVPQQQQQHHHTLWHAYSPLFVLAGDFNIDGLFEHDDTHPHFLEYVELRRTLG